MNKLLTTIKRWLREINPWNPLTRACHLVENVRLSMFSIYIDLNTSETLIITLWDSYGLPLVMPFHDTTDGQFRFEIVRDCLIGGVIDTIDHESVLGGFVIDFYLCYWGSQRVSIPCPPECTISFHCASTASVIDNTPCHVPPCKPPKVSG